MLVSVARSSEQIRWKQPAEIRYIKYLRKIEDEFNKSSTTSNLFRIIFQAKGNSSKVNKDKKYASLMNKKFNNLIDANK